MTNSERVRGSKFSEKMVPFFSGCDHDARTRKPYTTRLKFEFNFAKKTIENSMSFICLVYVLYNNSAGRHVC